MDTDIALASAHRIMMAYANVIFIMYEVRMSTALVCMTASYRVGKKDSGVLPRLMPTAIMLISTSQEAIVIGELRITTVVSVSLEVVSSFELRQELTLEFERGVLDRDRNSPSSCHRQRGGRGSRHRRGRRCCDIFIGISTCSGERIETQDLGQARRFLAST